MGLVESSDVSKGDVAAVAEGSAGQEHPPESIAGVLLPADWWQLRPRGRGSQVRKGKQPLIRLRPGLSYGTPVPVRICAGDF